MKMVKIVALFFLTLSVFFGYSSNLANKNNNRLIYGSKTIPVSSQNQVDLVNNIMEISRLRSKEESENPVIMQQILTEISQITDKPEIESNQLIRGCLSGF